jgi:hypothetical protein
MQTHKNSTKRMDTRPDKEELSYYLKHKRKLRAYQKKRYWENRDRVLAKQKVYQKRYWKKAGKRINAQRKAKYKYAVKKYEYIVRTCSRNPNGDYNYALTIPRAYVEEYDLFKKKFKMKVAFGKFILYTKQ